MTKEVLFVHGMYMNAKSWAPWVDIGRKSNFECNAISWPYHEGLPEILRDKIDPSLGKLSFGKIVQYYKDQIDSMDSRPLLIGHSIGGLVVQKLVNDGYARAAVTISSAPPQGIMTLDATFLKANFPHINPFAGNRPICMTRERFHFTFCNTMARADSDLAYDAYVVPESRNVPRSTLTNQAKIDFRKSHVPLLMISGGSDHLIPLALAMRNFAAYSHEAGDVEFREFSSRSHFICNEPGWEEIAKTAFGWLDYQDSLEVRP